MQQHSNSTSVTPPLTPRSRTSSPMNKFFSDRLPSTRRTATHHGGESSSSPSSDDDSKTKKHNSSISFAIARATNYITSSRIFNNNNSSSSACRPCLLLLCLSSVFILWMVYYRSSRRDVVCISSSRDDAVFSRVNFFGFDDPDSDFAALGVPWCRSKRGKKVEWTSKDLIRGLEEFLPIYERRPIKNNMYGMGFDHSFGLWFIARWLKPVLMIESGAFKGHSTWVLRQAMPDTRIISLSPRHPEKYLKKGPAYVDGNCTYYAGKDFVDFGSMDWGNVMKKHRVTDLGQVLVFFDDHQNELRRVKQALKAGFQHMVFEDNYDTGSGDHYSLRQICDQSYIRGGGHSCFRDSDEARMRAKRKKFWEKAVDIDELCGPGESWWGVRGEMRDNFNHSNKPITYAEHIQNSRFVESLLDIYWELPPVAGPSLTHQSRYDPARTPSPIVQDGQYSLFQRLGLTKLDKKVFNGYTQMVYIQISPAGS